VSFNGLQSITSLKAVLLGYRGISASLKVEVPIDISVPARKIESVAFCIAHFVSN
jgi:hypothetical protein